MGCKRPRCAAGPGLGSRALGATVGGMQGDKKWDGSLSCPLADQMHLPWASSTALHYTHQEVSVQRNEHPDMGLAVVPSRAVSCPGDWTRLP